MAYWRANKLINTGLLTNFRTWTTWKKMCPVKDSGLKTAEVGCPTPDISLGRNGRHVGSCVPLVKQTRFQQNCLSYLISARGSVPAESNKPCYSVLRVTRGIRGSVCQGSRVSDRPWLSRA
jgi:hypothetical protein